MKIILLGPLTSSFTKNDIDILSSKHKLVLINSSIGSGVKGIINLLKSAFKSLYHLFSSDVVISWFSDYATLAPVIFAKILGKKSIVIAGGYDVGYLPELNYGAKANKFRWFCTSNSFKLSDLILPVSHWAEDSMKKLIDLPKDKKIMMLYNGIKSERFNLPKEENRQFFITVSQSSSTVEYLIKGTDLFIQTAKRNPHYNFKLAGLRGDILRLARKDGKDLPNLEIIPGPLDLYKELIPLYQEAFAYLQLSKEESFGLAVLEAMRCGAVPIVSTGGALPEISGKYAQIADTQEQINSALDLAANVSREYREELSDFAANYDIKFRGDKLLQAVDDIVKKK